MQGAHKKVRIAFVGKAGTGKTTAAGVAMREGFTRLSLARPIKESLMSGLSEYPMPHNSEHFTSNKTSESRRLMQALGAYVRSINADWFVTNLLKECKTADIVVDDCRFLNEMRKFKEAGFKLVRIVRPGLRSHDTDPSETEEARIADEIRGYYTLYNDDTLEKFQGKVHSLIKRFRDTEKRKGIR